MFEVQTIIEDLERSFSPYHVVDRLRSKLLEKGYEELFETNRWKTKRGGRYFVIRNGSSLIAFKVPEKEDKKAFHFAMVHTDSPTFKIKPNPIIETGDGTVLNVEPYGGMIDSTWMDRPLTIAGRILVRTEKGIRTKLFCPEEDLLFIPNLCIHMNRTVNDGMKFNAAKDMLPLFSTKKVDFLDYLSKAANVEKEAILGFDLFLVNRDKPRRVGLEKELLSSPKLDDLASCYAAFYAFLDSDEEKEIPIFAAFDNEEVGSMTRQGANSTFLQDTIDRLSKALEIEKDQAIAASIALSIDNAHANHPNHPEISDQTTHVRLGNGVVIKHSARQSYTTDALSSAIVKAILEKEDIPYQEYTDRSDLRGGSTLGNISNSQISLASCDIGIAQLAMHSANELCSVDDIESMKQLVEAFYRRDILLSQDGVDIL